MSPPLTTLAVIAAVERELHPLIRTWTRVPRTYQNQQYIFFEHETTACLCAGIGAQCARRATEALVAIYHPQQIRSVGFAGALTLQHKVADILTPALIVDARDNSRYQIPGGQGTLITFMEVAGTVQKKKLAAAYAAQAIDMEAASVAAVAQLHNIPFAAIKVISDELDFEFPNTSRFITPQGQFNTLDFVFYASIRPWLWPKVAKLAANSNRAAEALCKHLKQIVADQTISTDQDESALARGRN